jgi:hypothetical protein
LNRQAVKFIKIHTSPNRLNATSSSVHSLKKSLEEMQSWYWDGAQLIIEHCDAYISGQTPEKGFLTLEEEILAIQSVNKNNECKIGMSINWGRSAIESKSVEGPIEHINKIKKAGLLRGLIFSGASDVESPYGKFKDTHMPPAKADKMTAFADSSLLTEKEIKKCLIASEYQSLDFLGIKFSVAPNDISLNKRVSYNQEALNLLDNIIQK